MKNLNDSQVYRPDKLALTAAIAILLGGWIYLTYGQKSLVIIQYLNALGFENSIGMIRLSSPREISFVRNQLPDLLWVSAGTILVGLPWGSDSVASRAWSVIPMAVANIGEFLQLSGHLPGRFDVLDLLANTIGYFLVKGVILK